MVFLKNILLFTSVAVAAALAPLQPDAKMLEKRKTYLDLFTDIGTGMRAIETEANNWDGNSPPDALISAINQMNDAIVAVTQTTRGVPPTIPIEEKDAGGLTHFIHLTVPAYVSTLGIALENKKPDLDQHPPGTQNVHDRIQAGRDSWKEMCAVIDSRIIISYKQEFEVAGGYISQQLDGIVKAFSQ